MQNPVLIFIFAILWNLGAAQPVATLTIENQHTEGSDFYFDLYLRRSSGSALGDIYLKDANFYLEFNHDNFTNPSISKVGNSPGLCNLKPTSGTAVDEQLTASYYFDFTAVNIIGSNRLAIEILGPTPDNQLTFDTRTAKIDNSQSSHSLGRFKISGISNPFGTAGLKWITSGSSLVTLIASMDNTPPFFSGEIRINAIDPVDAALPVELLSFTADIFEKNVVKLVWKTVHEIKGHGFEIEKRLGVEQWTNIGFVSGNQVQSANEYSFIDPNPTKGINYYRLKQIDLEGNFTYSNIVSIYFKNNQGIDVFPNPVTYRLFVEGSSKGHYQIINSAGSITLEGQLGEEPIKVDGLPSGIYILQMDDQATKFLKW